MRDIRALGGSPSDVFAKDFMNLLEQEEKECVFLFNSRLKDTYSMLTISGGAANGAYGAGLLAGWTQEGSRPDFKIVTGISAGAIIAPFAFLGSGYDGELKEFCTRYRTKDILRIRLSNNSFSSPRPLESLINKYFSDKFLKEIAVEYRKGRRLYVGTTNLDAQRLVIWDMGKIASMENDKAFSLFRKIILASSSVPIAFPPVYLNVEIDGKVYDEMHVDGGVMKQVFFLYDILRGLDKAVKTKNIDITKIRSRIYVLRNGYVDPSWKEVPDRLPAIAERTVETMVNSQSIGDIYQLYAFVKLHDGDFNLAYIPGTHISKAKEPFDSIEMNALFDLGFQEASVGYNWKKNPPGFDSE